MNSSRFLRVELLVTDVRWRLRAILEETMDTTKLVVGQYVYLCNELDGENAEVVKITPSGVTVRTFDGIAVEAYDFTVPRDYE